MIAGWVFIGALALEALACVALVIMSEYEAEHEVEHEARRRARRRAMSVAVVIVPRGAGWQVHREDCRDVRDNGTGGWDVDDWDDLVEQVFDGDAEAALRTPIMPCVGVLEGRP